MHLQWDYSIFIVAIIPNAFTPHLRKIGAKTDLIKM